MKQGFVCFYRLFFLIMGVIGFNGVGFGSTTFPICLDQDDMVQCQTIKELNDLSENVFMNIANALEKLCENQSFQSIQIGCQNVNACPADGNAVPNGTSPSCVCVVRVDCWE